MQILYECADFLIVEKPQNLDSEEKAGDCLPRRLSDLIRERGETGEVYPVHRLDRPTGGAIVYAKNQRAAAELSAVVAGRSMDKRYLTVVHGRPAEDVGELLDFLYHDKRTNKVFAVKEGKKGAKEARLGYRVIGSAETDDGVLSLLEVTLYTGRTHQIRAQFASRKLPVFGDRRYGSRISLRAGIIALWSWELGFTFRDRVMVHSMPPTGERPWDYFSELLCDMEHREERD